MENALEINNLCKSYGSFKLENVSFSLPKGYIMGFAGQNGSGKTTTIRSILNMAFPDSGEIKILGTDIKEDSVKIKQNIGVVFDDLYFAPHLNVRQIGRQLKFFYPNWSNEIFDGYLKRFRLPDKKKVGTFSKGMKMKFMIACALSHQAELLILDEPTSGLDPVARDELLDIFAEYIEDGEKSILFSTHITTDLEKVADYITILHDGKVLYSDEKDSLLEKFVTVKGDENDLDSELKKKLIGFHSYRNGFDAMLEKEYVDLIPDSIVYEKISIDEIMIYIAKEAANNEKYN